MFRIDDERVIDATRAGSIAHLINHSCEVCYLFHDIINLFKLFLIFLTLQVISFLSAL